MSLRVAEEERARPERGHEVDVAADRAQILGFVFSQVFASADMLRHAAEPRPSGNARQKVGPRPEGFYFVLNVFVQPVDDGSDGDNAGDADDDAENRQRRSYFVRPQRVQRDQQVFMRFRSGHLLRPQRNHGIETRSAHRRIDPEEQTDHRAEDQPQHRHPGLHRGRKRGECAEQRRNTEACRDADDAADQALHHAFGEELLRDIALGRAERAAHSDLLGPLGHRHQHHVHDDDAAHYGRDRTHHHEDSEERAADGLPKRDVAVFRADEEIAVHSGTDMPPGPQNHSGFILRPLEAAFRVRSSECSASD